MILNYLDVIAELSETTGTRTDREPGRDVILVERDEVLFALERTANGEWPALVTPLDSMAWSIDEAEIQCDTVDDEHDVQEIADRRVYLDKLDAIVGR